MLVLQTRNGCFNQYWPSEWAGTQPAYAVLHPGQLKNRSFRNILLLYHEHLKMTIQGMYSMF